MSEITQEFIQNKNFKAIFFILLSIATGAIAFGINSVAFPAILITQKISPFFIGIASAAEILAGVKISFALNKIIHRLNILKATMMFGVIYALSITLIYFYQNYFLWLFFCTLNGACWFSLFVIRNAWINRLLTDKNRSIFLALTTTAFCLGFALGSTIIKYLGALNYNSFLISASLIICSIAQLVFIKDTRPPRVDAGRIKMWDFVKYKPQIALSKFLLDMQNGCLVALTVIFCAKIGVSAENAGLLLAAFMASGLCDLYAGFLVQKYDRYKMIKFGFATCLIMILAAVIFHQNFNALLLIYFLFGAGTASIFVGTLTITNESFPHDQLIAANATFQSIGSLGSVFGSALGGLCIELLGFYGFFVTIIFCNIAYLTFAFIYEKNQALNQIGR